MNYLAHIYLSGTNKEVLIGNFIADAIKGKGWQNYPPEVQKGIKLHRAIDDFTDTHEIVRRSKDKLRGRYGHYSGVIVDIFYDHFLAKGWEEFHSEPLGEFVQHTYTFLQENEHRFPDRIRHLLKYMVMNNWLYHYQSMEGVKNVMFGMSKRTKYDSGMENSTDELREYYHEFKHEFETFFPLLMEFSESTIASIE